MKNTAKVKHNRGIKIESRIIISAILVVLQFAFLFAVLFKFYDYSFTLYVLQQVLAAVVVIYIVNKRGNPSYKLMWIIFILAFPIFGISVYFLWGGGRVLPHLKKKMRECESHYAPYLSKNEDVLAELEKADFSHYRQANYLNKELDLPVYKNSRVEFFTPGEKFLPRFLEELERAKKYIFLEFFIVAEGEMWEAVYEILKRKAAEGLDIRILFDDFGSIKRQHRGFIKKLKGDGIKVAAFNRIKPTVNFFMNNRNHRKIVVIDGKVAMTGGLNLADEYINAVTRFGYWLDSAAFITGEAVTSFLAMFCSMWEFTTGERTDMQALISKSDTVGEGFVFPYCDDPLDYTNTAEGLYMRIISNAEKYVYITTPYLIIDDTMASVLKIAAKSGIDVRIITPHIPDKWYVHPVTQYNYLELIEHGVKIYEYIPGFIHSKLFVSDDAVATIGTVNMDYRSFVLHFECGVWINGQSAVSDIKNHFLEIINDCEEITEQSWHKKSRRERFKCWILHFFAPFM